jgi:RNA polymerase sigma factor (sigma-70 family)
MGQSLGRPVNPADEAALNRWFCEEVLPLQPALTAFIRRHCREPEEAIDLRQEVYERVLARARHGLPNRTAGYMYAIAHNLIASRARRAKIVPIDFADDMDKFRSVAFEPEPELIARDEARRAISGLDRLPPRCREVVRLRKIEGLSTREAAERMGVGIDTVEKQLTLGIRAIADFVLGGSGKIKRHNCVGLHRKASV